MKRKPIKLFTLTLLILYATIYSSYSQCSVSINSSVSSICSGQSVNFTAITTNCGSHTFLWSNGQTTQSISVNPTNTGVANIQAPYTVTVTYASGTVSATKNVLVKPIPVITIHNNASNICSGDTCSIYPTSTVVNSTYQWTYSSTNITGASNGSGLAIVHTLNSTTLPIGTILYTITPRYGGCNGIAATTSVTVNTVPTVTFTNNRPGICSGDSTDIQLSSNVSSASFAWTYSPVDIAGAWADSGNYIHQALNATTTGTGMLTYNVTATNNSCSGIAYPVTVNVFPLPVTVVTTNNPVICSGDTALLTLSSVPAGATFSWNVSANNVTGASNGNTDTIYQQLSLIVFNSTGNVIYNVISNLNGCIGNEAKDTIYIKPVPVIAFTPVNPEICSGTSPNIQLSSDPSGAFFSWNLTSINGVNGASSGSGNIITDGLVSSDSIPGSVVYEIGAGLNGCNAVHVQDTVTVKPLPDVIVTPSVSTICSGAATNVQITSSQAGASYSWFATSNNVSGIYNGSGNYINQTLSVSVSSDSAIYSVTPTLNGCQGTATIAVVYVNPLPVINICGFNQSICSGESTNIYLQSQNAVNATFSWTATSTWVNGCGGGNGNTIAQNLTLNGSVPGSVVYNVTAIDSGCSASCSFTINVNPVPSVSITTALPDTICANYNPVLLAGNPAGGIFTGTGIVNSVFYPNLPGTGYSPIAYEFTNALGCSATAADSIYIDVCTGTEQVREIKSQDFSISPNPAAAKVKFTIRVPKEDRVWISIMDDKGREVFSSAVFRVESIYEYYFDVFGWGKGFYNVTLHGSNETITRKMIVADK